MELSGLNEAQREAVLCTEGPLLVLAGAGSGKTRVLTYRIANIINESKASPWEILAITFTNKAAAEMRERLSGLIGGAARGMWVSTFHSMCVRMLRADAEKVGFTRNFTIYDTDDQKRLVKTIMTELDINPKMIPLNTVLNRISQAKNELIVPLDFEAGVVDPIGKRVAKVYIRYQERLRQANAMDFDDLLLHGFLLLKNHADVLRAYQERFKYVMVDEYQDTNHAQYLITQLLAAGHKNIMVVGDDDQSIYSWRGADLRNILEFEKDYPHASVVKLEQNYRSVANILDAANAVIANNRNRKAKKLYTDSGAGDKIGVYTATDERDEGRWIAGEIEKLKSAGSSYNDMAVFYRTNAQSRMLEDMLLRAGVPYRIVGGTRFFERMEIRNVMAYLSVVVNPADDVSFERIVNVPRRGIGKSSVERIQMIAREMNLPEIEAAELLLLDDETRASTKKAIGEFISLIKNARTYSGELRAVIEHIVDDSKMIEALEAENTDEARSRIENIKELMGVVDEFSQTHDDVDSMYAAPTDSEGAQSDDSSQDGSGAGGAVASVELASGIVIIESQDDEEPARVLRGDSLADFIEWVRLRTDLDSVSEDGKAVTLMTVHSAKGLEFDNVFVAGMEESIFPHMNSIGEEGAVEEERRLAYVAITRARKRLFLTCAQTRQLYGQTNANPTSRFIREIPSELRNTTGLGSSGFSGTGWEKRGSRRGISGSGTEAGEGRVFGRSSASGSRSRTNSSRSSDSGKRAGAKETFKRGDTVDHKTFGRGVVIKADGDTILVKFAKSGQTKKLLKDYAPIVKISKGR
ncbi:MAG: UvrD-helicase domain-containing protein [Eggerthellaceae bacterium]|nr:UvrD-helicase domain-containing protein [Eggerthellaceae bacterium]